jgi:hypothetical protein
LEENFKVSSKTCVDSPLHPRADGRPSRDLQRTVDVSLAESDRLQVKREEDVMSTSISSSSSSSSSSTSRDTTPMPAARYSRRPERHATQGSKLDDLDYDGPSFNCNLAETVFEDPEELDVPDLEASASKDSDDGKVYFSNDLEEFEFVEDFKAQAALKKASEELEASSPRMAKKAKNRVLQLKNLTLKVLDTSL